jgi:hypothetical protein
MGDFWDSIRNVNEENTKKKKKKKKKPKKPKSKQKNPRDSTSHKSEWLRSKTQVTAHAGEDVEKEEHSSIAGEIAN